MTVEAETPTGVKTGSSVMEESSYRETFRTPETGRGGGGIRGEAVIVDLPNGPLFALLRLPGANGQLPVTEALTGTEHFTSFEAYFAAVKRLGGWFAGAKAELPRKAWPMMVRFRDIKDPKSVEQVDPATAGVKRILLQTTRDEVTTGIEKRLPLWFMQLVREKASFSGKTSGVVTTNSLADELGPGSFSTEIR